MTGEEEEFCDDYIEDQDPSFRSHTDITPDELTSALHSLELLGGELYLGLQVNNLTVIDQFMMGVEHHTLQEYSRTDRTPPEAMFLNAQSQMWIFAAYELLRTWRARAKDVMKWAGNGGLEIKAKSLEEDQGFIHTSRQMRAKQLRDVAANPSRIETIKTDLRRAHIPFSRIEHLRVSLAKHEVRGRSGSVAYAPGYGRINMMNGSLQYQLENGPVVLDTISRRDIADELRALKDTRCLVPAFDGVLFSPEWKEALWDKFYTVAPRLRTQSEQQYSVPLAGRRLLAIAERRKFRPRR